MNKYELHRTLLSPGDSESVNFMVFSPNGRFLIVGDGEPARLRVFDRQVGFRFTIEKDAASSPTSLTFESPTSFLTGFNDGRFVEYRIDSRSQRLVKGWTNNTLRGVSCITAIALDETSQILALAVGPSVFVFGRISETGRFQFAANISKHFDLECGLASPFPRSLCFSSSGHLYVAFSKQHVASVKLVPGRYAGLQTMSPASGADYSGLSVLRAVLSPGEGPTCGFGQFWIYGSDAVHQRGGDASPFLLVNGGAATLSASPSGMALINDVVTRRQIQSLKHDDSAVHPLTIAYHAGEEHYTIATASPGFNGTVKIWKANRFPSSGERSSGDPNLRSWRSWSFVVGLAITVLTASLWSHGFFSNKHKLQEPLTSAYALVLNGIRHCGTVMVYVAVTVRGTLMDWYRGFGVRFLLFGEENFGRG